ncbi:MAG: hypothetical protein ABI397_03460, partial [Candidatus Saccharimonas sp.]
QKAASSTENIEAAVQDIDMDLDKTSSAEAFQREDTSNIWAHQNGEAEASSVDDDDTPAFLRRRKKKHQQAKEEEKKDTDK